MKITEINKEDREFILFAYSLINSARYPSFEKVTETYNRVFGTTLNNTSCGTCIRQRILDLKKTLDKIIEKEKDASSQNISTSNENNELNGKEVNQSQEVKESDTVEGMEQPKKQPLKQQTKRSKKVKNI